MISVLIHSVVRISRPLALMALLALAAPAAAQSSLGEGRRQATRAELEQAALATEQAASVAPDDKTRGHLQRDAMAIRQRLRNGDFLPGDRIYLSVLGDTLLTDTFTVRGDRRLQLPNIPDISLAGVLDSELASHLRTELGRYLKNPELSATGLVRLTLTGAIGQNGFLTFPVDQAVTDVIMSAGGLQGGADLDNAEVKRSGEVIINNKAFREAIRLGRTVGDLSLRDGDEIYVPAASTSGRFASLAKIMGAALPLFWVVRLVARR